MFNSKTLGQDKKQKNEEKTDVKQLLWVIKRSTKGVACPEYGPDVQGGTWSTMEGQESNA